MVEQVRKHRTTRAQRAEAQAETDAAVERATRDELLAELDELLGDVDEALEGVDQKLAADFRQKGGE